MTTKFVVGYDGSAASRRALDFAMERAAAVGATIIVAHVLEWSPYSFLTPTELEERHKRRGEELARAESHLMAPLKSQLSGKGVPLETVIRYGHVADTLCEIATDNGAAQIFVARKGESSLAARVFGSVAGTLAQCAPVPCTIVP
ncbi:universal stress protein [Ruegeria marina]|uniref:Nucleotide-binding universal stress protein, UspA family n=1 Tax=Ruegeria marina TaxID=639004 RepID=A0A1G6QQ66_9RHOB|nr:universal stress protein [Ruegeria marina]SDC93886.1 Nucleotide-binding universal stress protein, UspA family [Ruegeria marina]